LQPRWAQKPRLPPTLNASKSPIFLIG